MKRSLVFFTLLCSFFASTIQAAESLHNRTFAGLSIARSNYALKDDIKAYSSILGYGWNNSYGAYVGHRWQQFGVQGSAEVLQVLTPVKVPGLEFKQRGANLALDGLYFLKLAENLELKSLVGVGVLISQLNNNVNNRLESWTHTTGVGARVGTGLQYQFTDHVVGEAMVKAQLPGNNLFKNVVGVSLGVGYVF